MPETIQDKIKRLLQAADGLYYRLVLLVGESGSGKTNVLRDVAADFDDKVININLALSTGLLELTAKQRVLRLPGLLNQIVNKAKTTIFLDNLEILFDKNLKQDPLRLLQSLSRNRSIVASWNGRKLRGKLTYAELDHPEYRGYDLDDTLIVCMDGTTTIDFEKNLKKAGKA